MSVKKQNFEKNGHAAAWPFQAGFLLDLDGVLDLVLVQGAGVKLQLLAAGGALHLALLQDFHVDDQFFAAGGAGELIELFLAIPGLALFILFVLIKFGIFQRKLFVFFVFFVRIRRSTRSR